MRPIGLITVVLAVLAGGGLASPAQAATLNVAANGVDGPACGAAATPCRTIGQAVLNADEGDRILVGPGVYGDLNEDDDLADDGEEEAGDPACDCMLQITKRLTFESSAGAAMTIIRGTTTLIAVSLEASGIIFGAHDRGFTISRGQDGLRILAGAVGVRVIGNVVNGPGAGVGLRILGDSAVIRDNVFSDRSDAGVVVDHTGGYTFTGNAIVRNSNIGLILAGADDGTVSGNAIIGNGLGVIVFDVGGLTLMRNAILGNYLCGVQIGDVGGSLPAPREVVVTQNNIYGNGGENCGLRASNISSQSPVQASRNFWGAASGPGVDPADQVIGPNVVVAPVATTRFHIAVDAGR